jgi:hypothetical protein
VLKDFCKTPKGGQRYETQPLNRLNGCDRVKALSQPEILVGNGSASGGALNRSPFGWGGLSSLPALCFKNKGLKTGFHQVCAPEALGGVAFSERPMSQTPRPNALKSSVKRALRGVFEIRTQKTSIRCLTDSSSRFSDWLTVGSVKQSETRTLNLKRNGVAA